MRKTKIVCTIGPAVSTYEKICELLEAGMNVARLNFSHGCYEKHQATIDLLKKARIDLDIPFAIMLDTKGPEIRLGQFEGDSIEYFKGQSVLVSGEEGLCTKDVLLIRPVTVLKNVEVGTTILFDDGNITSVVTHLTEKGPMVEIQNSGILSNSKGVNIPSVDLDLPSLTERDIADIKFACKNDLDLIAASFIRTAEDVVTIRRLLESEGKSNILIIAKIESQSGVNNFDSIIQVTDGIMIARGDLGVEVPLSQVPRLQKMMIQKCYLAGQPAITATQMLESMIHSPRPTRAEASDVANAIYDCTSMVMLSGETAMGRYPIETVNVMRNIIEEAENDIDYRERFHFFTKKEFHDLTSAVTTATVSTAYATKAKAIFGFTNTGRSTRLISRIRPSMPIISLTSNEKTYYQLASNWGVIPVLGPACDNIEEAYQYLAKVALEKGYVKYGDLVIVSGGSPFGVSGTTNIMMVKSIGDVLIRGYTGYGACISGEVNLLHDPQQHEHYSLRGRILAIPKCNEEFLPFVKEASGIILDNHIEDKESEKYAIVLSQAFNIPLIIRADQAMVTLKEKQLISLNPKQAIVYNGIVEDKQIKSK